MEDRIGLKYRQNRKSICIKMHMTLSMVSRCDHLKM